MTTVIDDELDDLAESRARDTRTEAERAAGLEDDARLLDPGEPAPAFVKVCDKLNAAGEVCGETISSADYADAENPLGSARAAWARHVRFEHPKDGSAPASDKPASARKPRGDKAPSTAAGNVGTPSPDGKRAEAYAQGLASFAMMAWLTPGVPVDDFDLAVMTNGAPMLCNALDDIGERHAIVRQTLDLILVGGGGPYTQLLFAALAIAGPIAAHHGFVPVDVGARWGTLIGVAEVPPPQPRSAPSASAPTTPESEPTAPADAGEPVDDHRTEQERVLADWSPDPATPTAVFEPLTGDGGPVVVASPDDAALAHA